MRFFLAVLVGLLVVGSAAASDYCRVGAVDSGVACNVAYDQTCPQTCENAGYLPSNIGYCKDNTYVCFCEDITGCGTCKGNPLGKGSPFTGSSCSEITNLAICEDAYQQIESQNPDGSPLIVNLPCRAYRGLEESGCEPAPEFECTFPTACGNKEVEEGEECDLGTLFDGGTYQNYNTYNSDHGLCSSECMWTTCGDGTIQTPSGLENYEEECDDGTANNDAGKCSTQCFLTYCGDGIKQTPNGKKDVGECGLIECDGNEQCDEGGENDNEGTCSPKCTLTFCTDGYTQNPNGDGIAEECDPGYLDGMDGGSGDEYCTQDCTLPSPAQAASTFTNGGSVAGFFGTLT